MTLARRALAEFVGTLMLLVAIVGAGIMAAELSPADRGLQLLQAALATGAALAAIIWALGPVSGAHLNPAVSLADRLLGGLDDRELAAYVAAQVAGGLTGTVVANLMFELPAVTLAATARTGVGQWLGEVVATFGLVLVIFAIVRSGGGRVVAVAVGAYIAGAHVFTSSTSFANPAVTLARTVTDTFAGIAPGHVPAFVLAQLVGTGLGLLTVRTLYPRVAASADEVLLPHADGTDPDTAAAR